MYSRKAAKKARQPRDIPEAFLVSLGEDRISVDRLDFEDRTEMANIAINRGHERSDGPKEFRGWAILTVNDASANGRTVVPSPLEENRYHADICLNLPDDDDRRENQKEHSVDLAARAWWEEPS